MQNYLACGSMPESADWTDNPAGMAFTRTSELSMSFSRSMNASISWFSHPTAGEHLHIVVLKSCNFVFSTIDRIWRFPISIRKCSNFFSKVPTLNHKYCLQKTNFCRINFLQVFVKDPFLLQMIDLVSSFLWSQRGTGCCDHRNGCEETTKSADNRLF